MESKDNYQRSEKELNKLQAQLNSDTITINMKDFDANTRGEIITALQKVINLRKKQIQSTYLGVQI